MIDRLDERSLLAINLIKQHIPSLTKEDDAAIDQRVLDQMLPTTLIGDGIDNADLALRTCACGAKIDGYYAFIDHLISVFGGEGHYGG